MSFLGDYQVLKGGGGIGRILPYQGLSMYSVEAFLMFVGGAWEI